MAEEVLTAKIRADVSEAVEGFRQVKREADRLQVSVKQIAVGFSGVVTAGMALYSNYARIRDAQMALVSATKELHETEITLAEYRKRLSEVTERYGADSLEAMFIMERIRAQEEMLTYKEMALKKAHEELATAYITTAATIIPNLITGMESLSNLYTTLKGLKGAVTVATAAETAAEVTKTTAISAATAAQWLYNKALAVTHALSGPLGWAILGVAAAVTAATAIWLSAQRQQEAYNQTLNETVSQTRELIGLQAELGRMRPLERLYREYVIVKRRYERLLTERRETAERVERVRAERTEALRRFEHVHKETTETVRTRYVSEGYETALHQAREYRRAIEDLHQSVGEAPSYGLVKSFEDAAKAVGEFDRSLRRVEGVRVATLIRRELVTRNIRHVEERAAAPKLIHSAPIHPVVAVTPERPVRPVTVSIGRIEVSTQSLGSPFDRDRAAEDLARKVARKLALRVVG